MKNILIIITILISSVQLFGQHKFELKDDKFYTIVHSIPPEGIEFKNKEEDPVLTTLGYIVKMDSLIMIRAHYMNNSGKDNTLLDLTIAKEYVDNSEKFSEAYVYSGFDDDNNMLKLFSFKYEEFDIFLLRSPEFNFESYFFIKK